MTLWRLANCSQYAKIFSVARMQRVALLKRSRPSNRTMTLMGVSIDRVVFEYASKILITRRLRAALSGLVLRFSFDDIPELDEGNFLDYVKSHNSAFVMWYDPLCPVCRKAMPHFVRLYNDMKGSLAFGVVNGLDNQSLAMNQDVVAYPTFRLYRCSGHKCTFKHHEGMLDYGEMKSFVRFAGTHFHPSLDTISTPKRYPSILHPSSSPSLSICRAITSSATPHSISGLPKHIKVGKTELIVNQNIMEVTGNNFKEKIRAFESVLVYFYTTWCMHCGESLGQFLQAADLIEDHVGTLAICNAEESLEIVDQYYVGKIPTLKFFRKGRYITDYIGEIKVELIVKFMNHPHIDEEFLLMVTRHKPYGDLYEGLVFTPTQKKKLMWSGKDGSGMIREVNNENIDQILRENPSLLLLFYTCWSRICVGLKHDYINVAKAVEKSDVVLAAVDCEDNVEIADRYLIHKFPTIKYFRDGQAVREFAGDYNAEDILKFLKDPSKLKIAPKADRNVSHQEDEGVPRYWKGVEGGDKILHFTDFNYKQLLRENPAILMMFYVPWCKPCTTMKREFAKAAVQLDRKHGVLAACDAEKNNEMADSYSVIKLPTVKYIKKGEYINDYTGHRKAADFVTYMKNPPMKKVLTPLSEFKGSKK